MSDPVDRDKLEVLFFKGRELVECPQCGRIRISAPGASQWYVPEPTG